LHFTNLEYDICFASGRVSASERGARSPGENEARRYTLPKGQSNIVRLLGLPASTHRIVTRFNRPNLTLEVKHTADAEAKFHRLWRRRGTIPLDLVSRAGATHQTDGIAKMVINKDTHEVVGVSLVMPNAGEVIHEAAMAMRFRARLEDYIDMIHVYPTMAEALKIAAISYFKDPAKLSCCAE
jgi:mercuric reductase